MSLSQQHIPAALGSPVAFLGQMDYVVSPVGSRSAPGSPPSWTFPGHLQRPPPPNQLHKGAVALL